MHQRLDSIITESRRDFKGIRLLFADYAVDVNWALIGYLPQHGLQLHHCLSHEFVRLLERIDHVAHTACHWPNTSHREPLLLKCMIEGCNPITPIEDRKSTRL